MDQSYWRNEARRLRREGTHLIEIADELDETVSDDSPRSDEPRIPTTHQPTAVAWFAIVALGVGSLIGLLALAFG